MIPEELKDFVNEFLQSCRQHPEFQTYGLSNWEIGGSTAMRAALGMPYDPSRDVDFFFNLDRKNIDKREDIGRIFSSILSQHFSREVYINPQPIEDGIAVYFSQYYYSIKVFIQGKELYNFSIANRPFYVNVQAGIHLETGKTTFDPSNPEFHEIDFEEYLKNKVLIVYDVDALRGRLYSAATFSITALASIIKTCAYLIENDGACFSVESARAILKLENALNINLVYTHLKEKLHLTEEKIQNVFAEARKAPAKKRERDKAKEKAIEKRVEESHEKALRDSKAEAEKALKEKTKKIISQKDSQYKAIEELYGRTLIQLEDARKKQGLLAEKLKKQEAELNGKITEAEKSKESLVAKLEEKDQVFNTEIKSLEEQLKETSGELKELREFYDDLYKPLIFVMFIQKLLMTERTPYHGYSELLGQMDEQFKAVLYGGPQCSKKLAGIQAAAAELSGLNEYHFFFISLLHAFCQFEPATDSQSDDYPIQLFLKLNTELDRISQCKIPHEKRYQILKMFIGDFERLMTSEFMSEIHSNHKKNIPCLKQLADLIRTNNRDFVYQSKQFLIYIDDIKNHLLQGKNSQHLLDFYKTKGTNEISYQLRWVMNDLYLKIYGIPPSFKSASNYALQQVALHLSLAELQLESLILGYRNVAFPQAAYASNSNGQLLPEQIQGMHEMFMKIKNTQTSEVDATTILALSRYVHRFNSAALNAVGVVLRECVETNNFGSVLQTCTLRYILTQNDPSTFESNFQSWRNLFNDPLFLKASNLSKENIDSFIAQTRNPVTVAAFQTLCSHRSVLLKYLESEEGTAIDLQGLINSLHMFNVKLSWEEIYNLLTLVHAKKTEQSIKKKFIDLAQVLLCALSKLNAQPVEMPVIPAEPQPQPAPSVDTVKKLDWAELQCRQWRRELSGIPDLEVNDEELKRAASSFPTLVRENVVFYQSVFKAFAKQPNPALLFLEIDYLVDKNTQFKKSAAERFKHINELIREFSAFFTTNFIRLVLPSNSPQANNLLLLTRDLSRENDHLNNLRVVDEILKELDDPSFVSAIIEGINTQSVPKVFKDFFDADCARFNVYKDKTPNLAMIAQDRFYERHPEIDRKDYALVLCLYMKNLSKQTSKKSTEKLLAHYSTNPAASSSSSSSSSSTSGSRSAHHHTGTASQERPG